MKRVICALVPATMFWMMGADAQAAVTFSFEFDQPSYELAAGASVAVPVYLVESWTDSSLLTSVHGLATLGVEVTGTMPVRGTPGTISHVEANTTDFDLLGVGQLLDTTNASVLNSVDITQATLPDGPTGTAIDAHSSRILAGVFKFTATGSPGDTATFQAMVMAGDASVATWDSFNASLDNPELSIDYLDAMITSSYVEFTIVPEPTTGILCAAGVFGLTVRRIRRRI